MITLINSNLALLSNKATVLYNLNKDILGLRLDDDNVIMKGDIIKVTDYKTQLINKKVYEIIESEQFVYHLKINENTFIKDVLFPIIRSSVSLSDYNIYIDDVVLHDESITINTYFDSEIDNSLLSNDYFKSYSTTLLMACYEMHIPNEFKKDYALIKNGSYSRLSDEYKSVVLSYHSKCNIICNGSIKLYLPKKCILTSAQKNNAIRINSILSKNPELKAMLENKLDVHLDSSIELSSKPVITNKEK